ncbi:MAG: hypothetical protein HN929_13775 [Chloroflexi bacterium]|jgi:hypothetical protein|nr:hypothetical protein [Chloroflexota bacterium]
MLEERKAAINDGQVRDKYEFATTTLVMDVYDQCVECDSTDGAFTVTLPNVALASGKIYTILLITDNGDITIEDNDESKHWGGDYTLDDAGDGYAFYSNGRKWWMIATQA